MNNQGINKIDWLNTLDAEGFETSNDRAKAIVAAEAFLSRVQSPWDQIHKLTWRVPAYLAALKVCIDTRIFDKWRNSGSSSHTLDDLSAMSGVEKMLLGRLLRHIVAMNGLIESELNQFTLTPFTMSLAGNGNSDCFRLMFESTYPAFLNLPSFLSEHRYTNPTSTQVCNWQELRKSPETFIQYIGSDAQRNEGFQNVMQAYNEAKGNWMDFYPIADLLQDLEPGRTVLVDAGGGKGFDIRRFWERYNHLPEHSLVLQDLPHVLNNVKLPNAIKIMAHDLFEPQPIKGARVYFTHIVFHGWPDADALRVLKRFAQAMEPGYSRLILHEKLIDESAPAAHMTAMDLTMMATFSSSERTAEQWQGLVDEAGMRIKSIYSSPALFDSIIEIELVEAS